MHRYHPHCASGLLLVLLVSLALMGYAQPVPRPVGWVNDYAGALNPGTRQQLEVQLGQFAQETTVEVAIFVEAATEGGPGLSKDRAQAIFDSWGIGKQGADNGLLIYLDIAGRRVEMATGYGLEAILPDQLCIRLLEEYATPQFRNNNWAGGLTSLVNSTLPILRAAEPWEPSWTQRVGYWITHAPVRFWRSLVSLLANWPDLWFLVLFVPIWLWKVFSRHRCPACNHRMKRNWGKPHPNGRWFICPACGEELLVEDGGGHWWDWDSGSSGGGFGGGSFGGGFGGFGGGSSGGGGAGASF